jgi:hypothetical protein
MSTSHYAQKSPVIWVKKARKSGDFFTQITNE